MTFGDPNPEKLRAWQERSARKAQERRAEKARDSGRFSSLTSTRQERPSTIPDGMRWNGWRLVPVSGEQPALTRGGRLQAMSARRRAELPDRKRVRLAVFERDGGCVLAVLHDHDCFGDLTFHHLLKEGQGGEYTMDNGLALCASGNGSIEDNPEWARPLGLVIAKGIDAVEAARLRAANGIAPNWRTAQEAA